MSAKNLTAKLTLETREFRADIRTLGKEANKTVRLLKALPKLAKELLRLEDMPRGPAGEIASKICPSLRLTHTIDALRYLNRLLSK